MKGMFRGCLWLAIACVLAWLWVLLTALPAIAAPFSLLEHFGEMSDLLAVTQTR